jgi:HSP20 family protein
MASAYLSPLNTLLRLQRALDRARGGSVFETGTSSRGTFPPINVFRDKDDYIVVSELPGIAREDLDVQVHRNRIRLTGRKSLSYGENVSVHRRERTAGAFDRTVALPFNIDPNSVTAEFRNGILALKLSPPAEEKPRQIPLT